MAFWHIAPNQTDEVRVQNGSLVNVKRVTYVIEDTGESGSFDVPMARYTPELVMAMAQDLVTKHVAVSNLRGEV